MTDYINHTIQTVTFPSVASDEIEQFVGRKTIVNDHNLTKNPQYWRQALDLERIIAKEFTVTLKAADGFINYWALFENYKQYLTIPNQQDYFPDFTLDYLDRNGHQILTMYFKQPLIKSLSEIEMNYTANAIEFRTFTIGFKYNSFEIRVNLD